MNDSWTSNVLLLVLVLSGIMFLAVWTIFAIFVMNFFMKAARWVKGIMFSVNSVVVPSVNYHRMSSRLVQPRKYSEPKLKTEDPGLSPRAIAQIGEILRQHDRMTPVRIEKETVYRQ